MSLFSGLGHEKLLPDPSFFTVIGAQDCCLQLIQQFPLFSWDSADSYSKRYSVKKKKIFNLHVIGCCILSVFPGFLNLPVSCCLKLAASSRMVLVGKRNVAIRTQVILIRSIYFIMSLKSNLEYISKVFFFLTVHNIWFSWEVIWFFSVLKINFWPILSLSSFFFCFSCYFCVPWLVI